MPGARDSIAQARAKPVVLRCKIIVETWFDALLGAEGREAFTVEQHFSEDIGIADDKIEFDESVWPD